MRSEAVLELDHGHRRDFSRLICSFDQLLLNDTFVASPHRPRSRQNLLLSGGGASMPRSSA